MAVSSVTRSVAGTPQRPLERRPGRRRRIVAGLGLNAFLWALALLLVFPLFWIVSTSLLPREQIMSTAQRIITTDPTLENYRELFDATTFTTAVGNSLVVSVTVTVVGTYFAALAGYAFGKLHFHGRDLLFVLVLLTMMVPPMVTVPVNFVLMSKIGLLNTLWAVILSPAHTCRRHLLDAPVRPLGGARRTTRASPNRWRRRSEDLPPGGSAPAQAGTSRIGDLPLHAKLESVPLATDLSSGQ